MADDLIGILSVQAVENLYFSRPLESAVVSVEHGLVDACFACSEGGRGYLLRSSSKDSCGVGGFPPLQSLVHSSDHSASRNEGSGERIPLDIKSKWASVRFFNWLRVVKRKFLSIFDRCMGSRNPADLLDLKAGSSL